MVELTALGDQLDPDHPDVLVGTRPIELYFQGSEGSLRDWYYNGSAWSKWGTSAGRCGGDPLRSRLGWRRR